MTKLMPLIVLLAFLAIAGNANATPSQRMTWTVDGVQREALVFAPAAGSPQDLHPLIFAFHGHGGNMQGFSGHVALQDHWPEAIVVYPQGLLTTSKRDPRGRKPGWQRLAGDDGDRDLRFFDTMLADLHRKYRVDDRHIYSTGFSNGAFFSFLLWIQRSDVFAGFAIVAGSLDPSQHLPTSKPVLQVAGEKDPLVTPDKARAAIAEERRVDQASGEGQACGQGCTLFHGAAADVKTLWHAGGHEYPPQAAKWTADFFRSAKPAPSATAVVAPDPAPNADASAGQTPKAEIMSYKSHDVELMGLVYKPPGNGPFPVYMWNHGSERMPTPGALLARFWVPQGFVLFAPLRSGHGPNAGYYIGDQLKSISDQNSAGGFRQLIALHERANDDVIAAYQWIARQPFVDPKRIVVAGGSYGGIQALLAAERDAHEHLGIRCVVAMAPAAESWANPNWATRLNAAIDVAHVPVFLLQAQNDFSLGPSQVLGPRIDAKGFPNRHEIFPSHGAADDHAQGHGLFFSDASAWSSRILAYLHDCGEI